MEYPILFIHGFGGNKKEYEQIKKFLIKNNFGKFYDFSYQENLGQVSIINIAQKLNDFVKNNVVEDKFNIIGISQGGIIARYYINFLSTKNVLKCVTVCSPHHGSLLAYLHNSPGFVDLRPNSDLLKKLEKESGGETKFYSVFNPLDLMVIPGTSAKFEKAEENIKVFSPLHSTTFSNKKTLNFILRFLR